LFITKSCAESSDQNLKLNVSKFLFTNRPKRVHRTSQNEFTRQGKTSSPNRAKRVHQTRQNEFTEQAKTSSPTGELNQKVQELAAKNEFTNTEKRVHQQGKNEFTDKQKRVHQEGNFNHLS